MKITRTERSNTDTVLRTDEQFLDGIGRVRWTHTASLASGPAIVEMVYDASNFMTARTQPYFAGSPVFVTSYTPDLVGRVIEINAPISESQGGGRITGFAYEGRNLDITDPKGLVTTRLSNALGQLIAITDPNPGGITTYAYHPFGELKSITDAAGNITSWTYNMRGLVTGTSDPDSGNWTYRTNAFGETTGIRDAKTASPNWTTEFTFDKLSRPKTRIEAEGTTTFTWGVSGDNSASNKYIGRLKSVSMPNYAENYTFDQLGRLTTLQTVIEGTPWTFNQDYSGVTGLPNILTYPVSGGAFRLQVQNEYQNNLLKRVREASGGNTIYWEAFQTDAWGNYRDISFGNSVAAFAEFDQASGLANTRSAYDGAALRIDAKVDWDLNGNSITRQDLQQNPTLTEAFVYDNLNRIASSTLNGGPNGSVTLNAIGNILSKDGQTYTYTGAQAGCSYYTHTQPRAVRKIGSTVYCYDANGNMVKRGGSNITYSSFNLPTAIASGSNSSTLSYGAFRNRFKQVAVSSGAAETTIYVAGLFERVTRADSSVEYRHQIPGGNGIAALHTRISGIGTTYYVHADHLGSPELITDPAGDEWLGLSFAAYGARRNPNTWSGAPPAGDLTKIADTTRSGFTGHEHLDSVGLIHMNGRVYDPAAGRFLGVDPIIQFANSQSSNSYSYVWNNPLTYVDPSGLDPVKGPCDYGYCEGPGGGGGGGGGGGSGGGHGEGDRGGKKGEDKKGTGRTDSVDGNVSVMYGAGSTVGGSNDFAVTQSATYRDTGIPQDVIDFAVAALLEQQQGLPVEIGFAIYRNDSGAIVRGPLVVSPISDPFATTIPIDSSIGMLIGVAHTHPYFSSDAILSQLNSRFGLLLDPDHNAVNRGNRRFGPGDDDVVRARSIPNFMRTPAGTQIKMLYLDQRGRLRQTTVWIR